MNINSLATATGFAVCVIVVVITIARQRRFDATDIGGFVAAFLSGTNLPPAVFLCGYAFWPDPPGSSKLQGLDKYVSFAGLALLLVSLVSIWALCRRAFDVSIADVNSGQPASRPEQLPS